MSFGTDKPMAAPGLTSYRYRGPFGFIMIGATDHEDALREANRSLTLARSKPATLDKLEVWDGSAYVACEAERIPKHKDHDTRACGPWCADG